MWRGILTGFLTAIVLGLMGLAIGRAEDAQIKLGDSKAAVLQRFGRPMATMQIGGKTIFKYSAGEVELVNGKVSNIDPEFEKNVAAEKAKQAYTAEQKAKGLVECDGKWVTPEKKAKMEKKTEAGGTEAKDGSWKQKIADFFAGIQAKMGGDSAAKNAYEKYAEFMARGSLGEAKPYATGAALAGLNVKTQPLPASDGSMAGIVRRMNSPQFAEQYKNQMINEMAPVERLSYSYKSVKAEGDSKVTIEAVQSLLRVRRGATALRGGVRTSYKHTVEVVKEGADWKVSSFREEGPLNK